MSNDTAEMQLAKSRLWEIKEHKIWYLQKKDKGRGTSKNKRDMPKNHDV